MTVEWNKPGKEDYDNIELSISHGETILHTKTFARETFARDTPIYTFYHLTPGATYSIRLMSVSFGVRSDEATVTVTTREFCFYVHFIIDWMTALYASVSYVRSDHKVPLHCINMT